MLAEYTNFVSAGYVELHESWIIDQWVTVTAMHGSTLEDVRYIANRNVYRFSVTERADTAVVTGENGDWIGALYDTYLISASHPNSGGSLVVPALPGLMARNFETGTSTSTVEHTIAIIPTGTTFLPLGDQFINHINWSGSPKP